MSFAEVVLSKKTSYISRHKGLIPDVLFLDQTSYSKLFAGQLNQPNTTTVYGGKCLVVDTTHEHIEWRHSRSLKQVLDYWGGGADELVFGYSIDGNNFTDIFLRDEIAKYGDSIGVEAFVLI